MFPAWRQSKIGETKVPGSTPGEKIFAKTPYFLLGRSKGPQGSSPPEQTARGELLQDNPHEVGSSKELKWGL